MNEQDTGMQLMEPASPEAWLPRIGLWPWWLAAGVLAVLLAGCWWWRRWRVRRRTTPDPAALRDGALREALTALDATGVADARDAAVRCSLILRRYLATATGDPALFETHEEFVARGDALATLQPEVRAAAGDGFARLAALKYGPEPPAADPARIAGDCRQLLQTLHQEFAA